MTTDPELDAEQAPESRGDPGSQIEDGAVLVATDLGHRFGDVTVLEGVSLALRPGTVTALVGPNGSGKTTLLRAVAGLLEPSTGSVSMAAPPAGPPTGGAAARPVGYLPQRPSFRPAFTVRETLAFYGDLAGEDGGDERVGERLDAVGLSGVADRRVEALSGGMVRLLGLAQATVGDPPVLVLDEPTSGLDPGMTGRIFSVVEDLAAEDDRAVLLASHDLGAVERAADEVLVLDRGGIVARGSPAAIVEDADAGSLREAFSALVRDGSEEPTVRAGWDDHGARTGRREGDR